MRKPIVKIISSFSMVVLFCAMSEFLVQELLPRYLRIALGSSTLFIVARLPFILLVSLGFTYIPCCEEGVVQYFKKAGYIVVFPAIAYFAVQLILNNGTVSYDAPAFYVAFTLVCQLFLRFSFFKKKRAFIRWLMLMLVGLFMWGIAFVWVREGAFMLSPGISIPPGEGLL